MKIDKFPSLNGLRAISILIVILAHLSTRYDSFHSFLNEKWIAPFANILTDGFLGVNVFFVISGFLITSLLLKEEQKGKGISLKNFYIRRMLRIFPGYYFLLLVYFIFQLLNYIHIENMAWLTALTYTKCFNLQLDVYTVHTWSLSVEEHFYLIWPLCFIGGKKTRTIVAVFLIILSPIVRGYIHIHPSSWNNDFTLLTRGDAIATGCLFALYKDWIINKISPYWNPIFYCSLISLFILRNFVPQISGALHLGFLFVLFGTNIGTITNIIIVLIMMYSLFGPQNLWFKMLNSKSANYIGLLSYSLYLWQEAFIGPKTNYWLNQFPQNIFCMIIAALFSYYVIEKPFLRIKAKFSKVENMKLNPELTENMSIN